MVLTSQNNVVDNKCGINIAVINAITCSNLISVGIAIQKYIPNAINVILNTGLIFG